MDRLRMYVCGHDEECLDKTPRRPFLHRVNLNKLPLGPLQDNRLAENRLFLSDVVDVPCEYVGFATWQWRKKHPQLPGLQQLDRLPLSPDILWYAHLPFQSGGLTWLDWYEDWMPGIAPYVHEMCRYSGLRVAGRPPLSNNFIMHWSRFQEFRAAWRRLFDYMHHRHPPDSIYIENGDPRRYAGYVYECASMLVLGGMRGLRHEQITLPPSGPRLPRALLRISTGGSGLSGVPYPRPAPADSHARS